jgi:methionine-rich copper-binding protein CopC
MTISRILAGAVLAAATVTTLPAFAHAKLQSSDPQAGATLASAPRQVTLKFNEPLEPAFSKLKLIGPGGTALPAPAATVDKSAPNVMTAPLPALTAGEYHLQWSTMTHDGHKAKGEITFKVK